MQQNPPFAQRLASLRSARNLNQVELAEATGLGKTTQLRNRVLEAVEVLRGAGEHGQLAIQAIHNGTKQ